MTLTATGRAHRTPASGNRAPDRAGWALILVCVVAFAVHFRPWQGGLVEEWSLVEHWDAQGLRGFLDWVGPTAGRPLHFVPVYLGMALSNGGFVGPFAVLGAVAALQTVATVWALRHAVDSLWVRLALGAAVSLHPWWAAGQTLRYLGAQTAILWAVVWMGCLVRYLGRGGGRWLGAMALTTFVGLLTYQGPAAALCIGAVAFAALVRTTWPRRVKTVIVTVVSVALVTLWTLVGAPRLYPGSYEATLLPSDGALSEVIDLRASINMIMQTLLHKSPALLVMASVLALLIIVLLGGQRINTHQALISLAAIAISPLSALVFVAQGVWLNDPERVAIPVGLSLWFVAGSLAVALAGRRLWVLVSAGVIAVVSLVVAMGGYSTWTRYAELQQAFLNAVAPARDRFSPTTELFVEDHSGEFGGVYTLHPAHIDSAFNVEFGVGADLIVCSPAGVVSAGGSPACDQVLGGRLAEDLGEVDIDGRLVRLMAVEPAPVFATVDGAAAPERDASSVWWWTSDQLTEFVISPPVSGPIEFRSVAGQLKAAECADQTVTLTLTAGEQRVESTVAVEPSGLASFSLLLERPTTTASLTLTPVPGSVCRTDADPRDRAVALVAPQTGP